MPFTTSARSSEAHFLTSFGSREANVGRRIGKQSTAEVEDLAKYVEPPPALAADLFAGAQLRVVRVGRPNGVAFDRVDPFEGVGIADQRLPCRAIHHTRHRHPCLEGLHRLSVAAPNEESM